MKHITKVILLSFVTMTMMSCKHLFSGNKVIKDRLEAIWILSEQYPDSAMQECIAIKDSINKCTEYEKKLYDLLNIRIRNKKDMLASSIDSIKTVAEYIEKHGTKKECMRAYYYLGSIYDDLNDSPHSVTYALKASSIAENSEECDTDILLKAYSLLSCVYRKQYNLKESTEMALKGLNLSRKANKVDCWSYMDVATAYSLQRNQEQKMKYYDLAYQKLLEDKDEIKDFSVASELLYTYAREKDYEKVDTLISIMDNISCHNPTYHYYYAMGVLYKERGYADSAITAFKKTLTYSLSPLDKLAILNNLFVLYYSEGEYKQAVDYAIQYQKCNTIINTEAQREWTQNANGQYNYIKERDKEEKHRREKRNVILMTTCIASLIFFAALGFFYYRRKNIQKIIEGLTSLLEKREREYKTIEKQYSEIQRDYKKEKLNTDSLSKHVLHTEAKGKRKSIIEHFLNVAIGKEKLSEKSWNSLYTAVEMMYPEFHNKIINNYPGMNEDIKRTCYLLKIGMTNSQIEKITDSSRQTTWYRVKKIQESIGDLFTDSVRKT